MNVLIIIAHPDPSSFNHAILNTFDLQLKQHAHQTVIRDLYDLKLKTALDRDDFDAFNSGSIPPDIKKEQEYISWADALAFIYPVWWWDRPAILKGYIDRIFSFNFAFSYGPGGAIGMFKHQKAIVIQTLGTEQHVYDQSPGSKDTVVRSMTEGTLRYCGISNVEHHSIFGICSSTLEERARILENIASIASHI